VTDYVTKDSGVRSEFLTGAVRDTNSGKGRFDLLPPLAVDRLLEATLPDEIGNEAMALTYAFKALAGDDREDYLAMACREVIMLVGGWWPAIERLAKLYERGAVKYTARNWEQGIPVARMFESGIRHLCQAIGKLDDEDHYAGFLFNFMGIMEYEERADIWDDDLYANLFADLGELYYRNNPERLPPQAPMSAAEFKEIIDTAIAAVPKLDALALAPRVIDVSADSILDPQGNR
jgi:hypothetical protein